MKILLSDDKVERWIEREHIKVSSILMILKKNLGYKNQTEIITKTDLDPSFLRIKLCWRNDQDYSELCQILNGIVRFLTESPKRRYLSGRYLLDYVAENGILTFISYYKTLEEDGQKSLMYWTLEKTIERWIKEKF